MRLKMSLNIELTRDSLEFYLHELAKTYHQLNKHSELIEIIIVGGASILINYDFRISTYDVDCFMSNYSILKRAINIVTDRYELYNGWINTDFKSTKSYSHKLREYSTFYKKWYSLEFRTIKDEYLVAMKLVSAREYKHDLVDIKGIIDFHKTKNNPLAYSQIETAVRNLYDNKNVVSDEMWGYLRLIININLESN